MALRKPIPPLRLPVDGGTSNTADASGGIPGGEGVASGVPTIPGTSAPGVPAILPTSNQLVQQGLDNQRGAIDYLVGTLVNKQLELLAKNDASLKGIIAALTRQIQQSYGQVLAQNSTVVTQLSNFLQSQLAEQAMLASAVRGMVPAERLPSGLQAVNPTGLVGSLAAAVHLPPIPPLRLPPPLPPGQCPPGYFYNGATDQCLPLRTPPPEGCPPGWGWSDQGGGRCLPEPDNEPPPAPPPPGAPPPFCIPGPDCIPVPPINPPPICIMPPVVPPTPPPAPPPADDCCQDIKVAVQTGGINITLQPQFVINPPGGPGPTIIVEPAVPTVNVQPPNVTISPTINVEPSPGGGGGPPPPAPPPTSGGADKDKPVEIEEPLSLLFGTFDQDYFARIDSWQDGRLSAAQQYTSEEDYIAYVRAQEAGGGLGPTVKEFYGDV